MKFGKSKFKCLVLQGVYFMKRRVQAMIGSILKNHLLHQYFTFITKHMHGYISRYTTLTGTLK